MCSAEEPGYRRALEAVDELAPVVEGETETLSPEEACEKATAAARYAVSGNHPVLLSRVLRAIEVPEAVVYESVMAACETEGDRAHVASELFLSDEVRAFLEGFE